MPDSAQTSPRSSPVGRSGAVGAPKRAASATNAARTSGAAPCIAITPAVGLPSKLPAHAPTVYSAVVPNARSSVYARVVPVFSATGKSRLIGALLPNIGRRASGSERMSKIR